MTVRGWLNTTLSLGPSLDTSQSNLVSPISRSLSHVCLVPALARRSCWRGTAVHDAIVDPVRSLFPWFLISPPLLSRMTFHRSLKFFSYFGGLLFQFSLL